MKQLSVLILILLLSSCNMFVSSSAGEEKVYIVSVGLDYANSMVSDLHGTIADASEVALCLREIYESRNIETEVILMTQKGSDSDVGIEDYPSAQNIIRQLSLVPADENDLVVFYFSGHGEKDGQGAFAAGGKTRSEEYSKVYLKDICSILNRKASNSIVILDCCYAGNASDFSAPERDLDKALKTMFSKTERENKVAVIASCYKDSNSHLSSVVTTEGTFENHSLFTIQFLKALGWVHSENISDNIGGINVCGSVSEYPKVMTVNQLMEQLSLLWSSQLQKPVVNRTDVPILLIPYKER